MHYPHRILITGVSGFVGRYLLDACRKRYPQALLFGISRNEVHHFPLADETHFLVADVCSFQSMRQIIAQVRPDMIFHLAAQSSVAASWIDPIETLQINAQGFLHLLEAVRQADLSPRILVVGSSEQYGATSTVKSPLREDYPQQPLNPYAVAKVTQDLYGYQYFVAYHLPIIRVRAFNHFGPYQPAAFVIANFSRQIALIEAGQADPVLRVGNLEAQRDFLPVQDVIAAYLALIEHGQPGLAYNVGSGTAFSIGDVARLLLQQTSVDILIQEDTQRLRQTDQSLVVADTSLLRAHTAWQPVLDMHLALKQTLDYWRSMI